MSLVPFRVLHSQHARETLLAALQPAAAAGRRAEAIVAAQVIDQGLKWYANGFGESRRPLHLLGELRCAIVLPITIWFAVHVGRWEVQVSRYRFDPRRPRP